MHIKQIILGLAIAAFVSLANASEGLKTIVSQHDVAQTMNSLERIVRRAEFRVFARIDHSRAADRVNIRLRPTQLLIFGKPQAGSGLMQSKQQMGIDLPVKYLVWRDDAGQVHIGWNDPAWLAGRHGVTDRDPIIEKMSMALEKMAQEAALN